MRHIKIEENEANQRLDRFINKYLDRAPKSLIQKYIRKKKIKINKNKASPTDILEVGDIVNIYIYDEVLSQYQSKKEYLIFDKGLDYLWQDENIAIVNKAAGITMYGDEKVSLLNLLLSDLIKSGDFNPNKEITFTPTFSNRLDRNTAGLVIACKNADTLRIVNELIRNRKIEKRYRTIVHGLIEEEITVDKNIKELDNNKVTIAKEGKNALSIFTPIQSGKKFTLIDANLITGRKHQLRAHLQSIGHPIIGDYKYGYGEDLKTFNVYGQYLISYKVIFDEAYGPISYLKNKEFVLDENYINKDLEEYYLNL